jgi:hypothetical protein
MIVHILLLQPKPETTEEAMKAVLEQGKALQHSIPGITAIHAEINSNPNNKGYSYGLILHFVDTAHFQAYFPHPAHKAVSSQLRALCDNLLNFDYEAQIPPCKG